MGNGDKGRRTAAAVLAARGAQVASRLLGRGGGTALPGLVAQRIDPDVIGHLAQQLPLGSIAVSATNGKTTTTHALASILAEADYEPVTNRSGSNLLRGIATTLVEHTSALGRLDVTDRSVGLFEVDEATLPAVVEQVSPRLVLMGNLARDQLDRYGELDAVAARWADVLKKLPQDAIALLNADDPAVAALGRTAPVRVVYYGLNAQEWAQAGLDHAADAKFCPFCSVQLKYDTVYFGHMGHYRCPGCGWERPRPAIVGKDVRLRGLAGFSMAVEHEGGEFTVDVSLPGLYNAYNALGAAAAAITFGVPDLAIVAGLSKTTAAFGRAEQLGIDGRHVYLLLAKNPVGLNAVLRTLTTDPRAKHLLAILNDDIADGQDVSWIWDADWEVLKGQVASAVTSGRRAEDMALRLKYAGIGDVQAADPQPGGPVRLYVQRDLAAALQLAVKQTPPGETLYILPTYTAMMELRDLMTRFGYLRPYWKLMQ